MHPYALPSTLKIKFFWRKDLNRTSLSTHLFFFFFFSSTQISYPYGTAHILIFVSPSLQLCLVQIMSLCLLLYLIFIYYWFMVSSRSWPHCVEQVLCCFVGLYSKQLLFVCFFLYQGMESAPIGRHENLPYLLDRFGIIPDNKYPVWTIFSSLQHAAVTGPL